MKLNWYVFLCSCFGINPGRQNKDDDSMSISETGVCTQECKIASGRVVTLLMCNSADTYCLNRAGEERKEKEKG